MHSFETDGKEIYQLRMAMEMPGGRAIIAAAYDGTILAYSPDGKPLWQSRPSDAFPYDLAVGDIDGDGFDEVLVPYSDGVLHAMDHDGQSLWHFESGKPEKTPPLYQACIVRSKNQTFIFTGGISQDLFQLSVTGELLGARHFPHPIRHIRSGKFVDKGAEELAVMTTSKGLNGEVNLFQIDPETMKDRWMLEDVCKNDRRFRRCFSLLPVDLDGDGYDEIAFSHNWDMKGKISIYSRKGDCLFENMDDRIPNVQYRMNLLSASKLPGEKEPFLIGFYGNTIIVYGPDGTVRETIAGKYSHTCGTFDPTNGIAYLGSDISGGEGIFVLDMKDEQWGESYQAPRPCGTLAKLERNLESLYKQIANFTPPTYQPPPRKIILTVDDRMRNSFGPFKNIQVLTCVRYNQKYESQDALWNRSIHNVFAYDMTADEIIDAERYLEQNGIHHTIKINHTAAVYASPDTIERILETAPNTLHGFEFSEMAQLDEEIRDVVLGIMLPLAESCRKHGKHIILQNKSPFWTANIYADFWKDVLMKEKFREVFIPSLEETNTANQDMSIAGRIGLWKAGIFEKISSVRFSLDNPCFDRMWEWSTQENYCHFLRHGAFNASLGVDYFDIAYSQGNSFLNTATPAQRDALDAEFILKFFPVFALLDSGVIHIPEKEELLSVTDCAVGMVSPLSKEYLAQATAMNHYDFHRTEHPPLVFDRCACYWGGAPVLPHSFPYYAMNSRRRMLNFLPVTPFGMVPILPAETDPQKAGLTEIIKTDGEAFLDESGQRHGPREYKPRVLEKLESAARKLPVLVEGDAAWTAVRLDPEHIRVTLVDPGYVTPADRDVAVSLQGVSGISCEDILSKESLPIVNGKIRVSIPMGTLRVLDVAHRRVPHRNTQ